MTIIVGVKCTDGVVIGADSIATSASGATPIMQIEANDKIRIFNNKVIVATTGPIGYTQRLHYHLDKAINGGGFLASPKSERPQLLCKRFVTDLQSSMATALTFAPHGLGFGALMATEISGDPCLIEYAVNNFQPEFKEKKTFYASMGSGQPLADPFLAFVSRVLWKNTLPNVRLGRFGLFWALNHTINLAPGLVGFPIKLAALSKQGNNWFATEILDHQEAEQFITTIESKIVEPLTDSTAVPASVPLPPSPPQT